MYVIWREEVVEDHEYDFFDLLRRHGPGRFVCGSDERFPKLLELRFDLLRVDSAFERLSELRPLIRKAYQEGREVAMNLLAQQAKEILPYLIIA